MNCSPWECLSNLRGQGEFHHNLVNLRVIQVIRKGEIWRNCHDPKIFGAIAVVLKFWHNISADAFGTMDGYSDLG